MRKSLAACAAALALAGMPAANAASYDNAARLIAATELEVVIERSIGDAVSAVRRQLTQQGAPAAKMEAFLAAFRDELTAAAPTLVEEMTRVYADRFSDAEIEDLVEFYESPTGRKLVDVQYELATAQTEAVGRWIVAAAQAATEKLNAAGISPSV